MKMIRLYTSMGVEVFVNPSRILAVVPGSPNCPWMVTIVFGRNHREPFSPYSSSEIAEDASKNEITHSSTIREVIALIDAK